MIGKTALALAAAAFIAASAAVLMGAAALALFWVLQPMLMPAGAAACVAGAALLVLLMALGIARTQHIGNHHRDEAPQPEHGSHPTIALISGALKQRPLLLIGLAGLTGVAAMRSPDVLRSVVEALMPPHGRS
jgi:hypothetical protein